MTRSDTPPASSVDWSKVKDIPVLKPIQIAVRHPNMELYHDK
jgi:hypothetical protein